MNTLSYNGYIGSVNFSEKDGVFYGKLEGIDGLVNFQEEDTGLKTVLPLSRKHLPHP